LWRMRADSTSAVDRRWPETLRDERGSKAGGSVMRKHV
jgi:hypothetical protein